MPKAPRSLPSEAPSITFSKYLTILDYMKYAQIVRQKTSGDYSYARFFFAITRATEKNANPKPATISKSEKTVLRCAKSN